MNINKKSILISIVILALIVSGIYFLSNYSKFFKNIYSGFKSSAGESAKDYYTKGIEFYKAKKYDKAISAFKNAIDLDPQFKRAYIKSATIFIERRNFDDAIVYFEKLIEQHPEISFPYFARGLVLAEKKDYANAIKNYQQAIQLNLKFASVYAALA
ncbi:MAG TPA: tetratricopeptide repeat protein, partial [bacterium]